MAKRGLAQVGVLNDVLTNVDNVVRKGRLGPGQTVVADLTHGTFKENTQIAKEIGSREPYADWLSSSIRLADLGASSFTAEPQRSAAEVRAALSTRRSFLLALGKELLFRSLSRAPLQPQQAFCNSALHEGSDRHLLSQVLKLQAANGFGQEDSTMIIEGMATTGAEPTYCMGDDIPLPVLSSRPHQLGDYFKQRFAQAWL
jgi:glutamate synthase (ferredoxin)